MSNIGDIGPSRAHVATHGAPGAALIEMAPRLLLGAAFLAAYVMLEWLSFIHEYKGVPITPWNPGLGVVFALMLSAGARYGVVLFAAWSSPRSRSCAAACRGRSSSASPPSSRSAMRP